MGVKNTDEAFASDFGLDVGRKDKQEKRMVYLHADLRAKERKELYNRIVPSAAPGNPFVVEEKITLRLPDVDQKMKVSQDHIKPRAMPGGTKGKLKVDPVKGSLLSGSAKASPWALVTRITVKPGSKTRL